jgi:hypothetical protein
MAAPRDILGSPLPYAHENNPSDCTTANIFDLENKFFGFKNVWPVCGTNVEALGVKGRVMTYKRSLPRWLAPLGTGWLNSHCSRDRGGGGGVKQECGEGP